jgi:tRNA(Ile2) C34 agmatinyltransferase TiaS
MGWFSNPKCPRCGTTTVATGAGGLYPKWRCNRCCEENRRIEEDQKKITELEKRIKDLENNKV